MLSVSTDGTNRYALKKMFLQSSEFERCAQSEVTAFGRFHHPNILKLLDSVTVLEASGGREKVKVMYLLFPLLPRGSLRDVLNSRLDGTSRDPLPTLLEVLGDFLAIAEALNVLHTFGPAYVHQDVKPENVLVRADGTPILMDFGSVRLADVPVRDRSKALKVAEDAALVSGSNVFTSLASACCSSSPYCLHVMSRIVSALSTPPSAIALPSSSTHPQA